MVFSLTEETAAEMFYVLLTVLWFFLNRRDNSGNSSGKARNTGVGERADSNNDIEGGRA